MKDIYLDNSSTTAVAPEVIAVIERSLREHYGNPSSLHSLGLEAENAMNRARSAVSSLLGCAPEELIFTASGTEANNTALFGAARLKRRRGNKIIISGYEHPSVDEAAKRLSSDGFEAVRIAPGKDGKISPDEIVRACDEKTVLVSVMMVNNEIGAINDISAITKAVKAFSGEILVHCDAVQAFGKIPFSSEKLGVDLLSVSAHKIHAPKGSGALFIKKGLRLPPYLCGGGQERGFRSSTESVPLIEGFGDAVRLCAPHLEENLLYVKGLRDTLINELEKMPEITVNSPDGALPYILNISVGRVRSETMLHFLESRRIFVSSGSACSKGALSPTLTALGLSRERADSAIRISFSRYNTQSDVHELACGLRDGLSQLITR